MGVRPVFAAVIAALVVASPAGAASVRPGEPPPGACNHNLFSDRVGTGGVDVISGDPQPLRIYGLTGSDWLTGSETRASCLFGGQGDDVLVLNDGGGIAYGESGDDVLQGSTKDDALSG